jgi:cytochrome b subunit of formate dehydrogenase
MEWTRWQKSPWGQPILIGLSWDLAWVALAAGGVIIAAHLALYHWRLRVANAKEAEIAPDVLRSLPERILRHSLPSRLFHWTMAASVLTLLLTAFLPIAGIKFSWVAPHWIAGFVLTAAIAFHVIHTTLWKRLGLIWVTAEDIRRGWSMVRTLLDARAPAPGKPGKNPVENKLFHHGVAAAALAAIGTGLVMMAKVDTPWWRRNPFLLSEDAWGIVYVVHGIGSVALITLILVHFYFALRPEKWWITLSMLRGWISREHYLARHDPLRWAPEPMPSRAARPGAATRAAERSAPNRKAER